LQFIQVQRSQPIPNDGLNVAYLKIDNWNDYSFVTSFGVTVFDEIGGRHELGSVKIGFVGQTIQQDTHATLPQSCETLPEAYFSLGTDESYYRQLWSDFSISTREAYLTGIKDIVFDESNRRNAAEQRVFSVSLLRSVSLSTIDGQFKRVLGGGVPLSDFNFGFHRPQSDLIAGVDLEFAVSANSTPTTNIHTLIGRNGVGKTSLLNEMVAAIMNPDRTDAKFYAHTLFQKSPIDRNYFSTLVSVAFSAFDPFHPPREQADPAQGTCYYYVGLKDAGDDDGVRLKSLPIMREECIKSIGECFSDRGKRDRWCRAISTLESDENFAHMDLKRLTDLLVENFKDGAKALVDRMSSGHAIVLLTISQLVAKVEEKTLVLLDEPECHLHPPLLSAFTRALSEILTNRNAVAIIATHSPVVLQEVPKSCAWIVTRSRLSMHTERPRVETFGENVGVLTREVFGLEVSKSGFHALLEAAVNDGGSYDEIVGNYKEQIGLEARGILRAMIIQRNTKAQQL
jgi:ABC-type branched-subunit amino acid transport system ATPase component